MMRFNILAFLLFLVCSCGTTVDIDYNKDADFSQYKSYNYYPDIDSNLSEFDNKRIIRATDSILSLRGFEKSETPQFLINFYAKEIISNSGNSLGIGIGGGGGNVGVGVSGGIPIGGPEIEQELTVDFVDATKDDLIWKGVSNSRYKEKTTPEKKEKYYSLVLNKVLSKFPPKK